MQPLCKENGVPSDHLIIAASAQLPRVKKPIRSTFSFRPITARGTEKFKALLLGTDWSEVEKKTSSESALCLTELLDNYIEDCFPLKTRKISNNDAPWFNNTTRRLVKKKGQIYKKEGKSENYKRACRECNAAIADAKKIFIDNVIDKCKKARSSKGYYKAVRLLNSKEAPIQWEIFSLYPELDESEIAEIVAEFFNGTSKEYPSLPDPSIEWNSSMPEIIAIHEVAARIKSFKKPKSTVYGDINPVLVTQFSDLLAIPLHFIFNQALNSLQWPEIWKAETVSVIPKNAAPSGLSELRNLSCTPLYSKILESFVLDKLKEEVTISKRQYGGIKGSGTDHFLVDTWNEIITTLEAPDTAANLISVDFAKAFNRMHHYHCLEALADLGAEMTTIDWVACFLYKRTMSVRIGNSYSVPRDVPGGSPQGSILGNFLFCSTTNAFTELGGERTFELSTDTSSSTETDTEDSIDLNLNIQQPATLMSTPVRELRERLTSTPSPEHVASDSVMDGDDSFDFFRVKRRFDFDSTESEPEIDERLVSLQNGQSSKKLESYVYIDDFNSIEEVKLLNAPSHITTQKCKLLVKAAKSERLFERINTHANNIGMRVNSNKTQMLCIHPCVHNQVETHIEHHDVRINSTNDMKILGFNFDRNPNSTYHVTKIIEKFYSRLWTLRFLKRGGLGEQKLLELYNSVIRSAVEYSSVAYHSMIPRTLSNKLENIQRQAMHIIFGWDRDITSIMAIKNIETLEERREKTMLNFALKNEHKERYGKRWFNPAIETDRAVRQKTRDKYRIPRCRTERMLNNPVTYMTKLLNKHYRSQAN